MPPDLLALPPASVDLAHHHEAEAADAVLAVVLLTGFLFVIGSWLVHRWVKPLRKGLGGKR